MRSSFIFWSVLTICTIETVNCENSFAKALSRGLEHSKLEHADKKPNEPKNKTFDVVAWTNDITDDVGKDLRSYPSGSSTLVNITCQYLSSIVKKAPRRIGSYD